ncbi:MAG TPA: ATPase, T2SS/T4P/T4SS family [Acidobacteriaceae bacterium]|jgi:pilus assembly protein CpaF|nr:ATPase, T2SS/T4P/T4SS family [Acidobacteriaceae bacterium]
MSFDIIIPFLKPIEHLLMSDTVSEIMVNSDASVWMEENGQKQLLPGVRFEDGALNAGLEVIANRFGKKLNADSPILNLRLPDGSRLAAIIPPVVNPHPLVTIRKFTSRNFGIDDLVTHGMLTEEMAESLAERVRHGDNILVAGATASGKTTLISVLADFIPEEERILVIEDTAELHIRKPHVVSAESQTDTHRNSVTFDDLLRAVLRHRPDRIIVGEVRGSEARTLLDAMNTGHRGTLATIHASGAEEAVHRLATLAMRASGNLNLNAVEAEIKRCLDLIVYITRRSGTRVIESLLELRC